MNRRDLIKSAIGTAVASALKPAWGFIGIQGGASPVQLINPMGTNYAAGGTGSLSYEALPLFKNIMRSGRGFTQTASLGTQVALTAAGWPAGDFACVLQEGANLSSWCALATVSTPMKCGFIGTGSETVSVTSLNGCTIANIVHGTAGAYTTFDLYNITGSFGFQVTGTTGGVTNVFAYHPSYPGSAIDDVTQTSAYIPETVTKYASMAGIRAMWMSYVTNNTGQNTSTTRHTPSNCQSNQGWFGSTQNMVREAYPAEWMAYFCKACGPQTALYYCLPAWEDGTNGSAGTYSNSLLTMFNSVLIPNGNKIYLELGNELWNSGSYPIGEGSGETLNTLAVNSGIATSNTDYAGVWKYVGYRLHALANMCRTIFGSAFGTQVFIVLAGQTNGYNSQHCNALNYIATNYGATQPAQDVQYLSVAPYVNLTNNAGDTSVALVLSDLGAQGQVQPYQSKSEHLSILARRYGMKMLAYEAGWQTNSEASGNAYISSAIMDPGMETTMRDQVWKPMLDSGYDLIFNMESGVNGNGAAYRPVDEWANNESTFISSGSPRYNAETDLSSGSYTPQRNVLTSRGQVFGATAWADNPSGSAPAPEYNLFTLGYGNCMQINVPAGMAGTYAVSLNVTGTASAATVEVNGATLYTGALASGSNSLGSVALVQGKNSIIVYNVQTLTSANSITLT